MINWKVRFKQKQFIVALISLLLVLANQIAGMFGYDITIYSNEVTSIAETVLMILSLLGIVVDPTTEGFEDSMKAQRYEKPFKDYKM